MSRPAGSPEPGAAGAGVLILAWGEIVLLGFLAIVGAFFASANASPGDYACGMILMLAAIALAFLRIKARLDGVSESWAGSLLVERLGEFDGGHRRVRHPRPDRAVPCGRQ